MEEVKIVELTPGVAGNALIFVIIVYVITIGYSIYMAVLNHKQAKVKEEVGETNEILRRIEVKLDKGLIRT